MSKHTPGEWEVREGDLRTNGRGEFIEISVEEKVITSIEESEDVQGVSDEERANAHLIASAPDLLEACKNLIERYECDNFTSVPIKQAKQAIAKAEGEE